MTVDQVAMIASRLWQLQLVYIHLQLYIAVIHRWMKTTYHQDSGSVISVFIGRRRWPTVMT